MARAQCFGSGATASDGGTDGDASVASDGGMKKVSSSPALKLRTHALPSSASRLLR